MPKISILSESLINKIAAGEVIERPASVVRELLDNSIDAGAKNISVEILYGGKKLIKVSDDGIGMDKDDAVLCFERHATSKILQEDDLFNIHTLGFRGEALSSIASVSKITLITSLKDSGIGTKIEVPGGQGREVTDAPPSKGTVVEIRDLFYNTPARRKFLKTTSTELSHIIETVMQKALAYHDISFKLQHGGSEIINVPSAKTHRERFIQIYGEEMFGEFLETKGEGDGLKVYGFLSTPDFTRAQRTYQYIFINSRAVKNSTVSHAIYAAYEGLIPKDRHPAFFLFLDIDPQRVDVNVHPAKREVRFESAQEIHRLVETAVYGTLNKKNGEPLSYEPQAEKTVFNAWQRSGYEAQGTLSIQEPRAAFFTPENAPLTYRYLYIGEPFVAVAIGDGITIIDQHAAHERILYERFLKKTGIDRENLFLPIRVEMPAKEFNIIINNKGLINEFGFDIEDFGANNIIIRAMPKSLRNADIKGLLMDISSGIIEAEEIGGRENPEREILIHNIASRLACHKSVRGKDALTSEELSRLIADLNNTETPDKCPHGRPTRINFSLEDLRKMFKRT
ncbi:MAG: DNA mismatch repair endonuclease MutL [Nitrospirae bacterium]|nr:DNA mismatch repair endonuclease MutL [Nitrospirota bacterium]